MPARISRAQHEARFRDLRAQQGIVFSQRGCDTSWVAYLSALRRAYAADNAEFETTNGQRAAALRNLGRARCARTVQRHHALLELMNLAVAIHVKRGRATPGFRDCLRIRMTRSFVAPPTAAEGGALQALSPSARKTASGSTRSARRDHPPPLRGGEGSEREEGQAAPARSQKPLGSPDLHRCEFDACDGSGLILDWEQNTARPCRCRSSLISRRRGDHA